MSSEGWIICHWGQDGYGLLISDYLAALSLWDSLVDIIPCIYTLEAFSLRYRHFLWSRYDCMWALVRSQLTWKTGWQQYSTTPHQNCCTESTSASGDQHAHLLWRPAVLWLEHFAFSHHSLPLSLAFSPFYDCQLTTANHTPFDAFSSAPLGFVKKRQPVFSVQWSHLSTRSSQPRK